MPKAAGYCKLLFGQNSSENECPLLREGMSLIEQIANHIAKVRISKLSEQHLTEYPQLAMFSFDCIANDISLRGRYENDELTYLENYILPNLEKPGTCLDVGANIGNHAVAFAPYFENVIAFEPNLRTFQLLGINANLFGNITALNFGASSISKIVEARQDPRNIGATAIKTSEDHNGSSVKFELVRIDDVKEVQESKQITFMKLDIEGHELEALNGAEQTIRMHRPIIAMEVLPGNIHDGSTRELRFLFDLGYNWIYGFQEAGWLGRSPRKVKNLARLLMTLVTGKRHSKAGILVPMKTLEERSYSMVLCSFDRLPTQC